MRKTGYKILAISMAMVMGMLVTGCNQTKILKEKGEVTMKAEKLTTDTKVQALESYDKFDLNFTTGTMRFSTDLLKESVALSGPQNIMISPTSVQMALAIAANGADGETLSEMQALLTGSKEHAEEIDVDTLNQYLEAYAAMLTRDENVSMNNANSIWIRDDEERFRVSEEYLKRIAAFQAEAYKAPFDDSTLSDINNWVKENTNDMIPSILSRIPDEAILYIVNAIAFEGTWEHEFVEGSVRKGDFTNAAGNVETVQMMHGEENMYLENENVTGFVKPYKGGNYAYVALLPKEGDATSYVLGMEDDELLTLLDNVSRTDVNIAMPKYKSEYDIELNQVLMNLGMTKAFTTEADFSKLGTSENPICISEVKHKTFIEVDEKGTKAAAATVVAVEECAAVMEEPKCVVLDRPFVYAIIDMDTKLPVFLGVLNSVEN